MRQGALGRRQGRLGMRQEGLGSKSEIGKPGSKPAGAASSVCHYPQWQQLCT